MLIKRYFVRNEDGSLKTKAGCADCDWPNWHVCPNRMGPDQFPALLGQQYVAEKSTGRSKTGWRMSDMQKEAIAESQRKRHMMIRRANLSRDLKVQEDFENGFTKRALQQKYKLSYHQVGAALDNSESMCFE